MIVERLVEVDVDIRGLLHTIEAGKSTVALGVTSLCIAAPLRLRCVERPSPPSSPCSDLTCEERHTSDICASIPQPGVDEVAASQHDGESNHGWDADYNPSRHTRVGERDTSHPETTEGVQLPRRT